MVNANGAAAFVWEELPPDKSGFGEFGGGEDGTGAGSTLGFPEQNPNHFQGFGFWKRGARAAPAVPDTLQVHSQLKHGMGKGRKMGYRVQMSGIGSGEGRREFRVQMFGIECGEGRNSRNANVWNGKLRRKEFRVQMFGIGERGFVLPILGLMEHQ